MNTTARAAFAAIVFTAVTVEARHAPIQTTEFRGVPAIYATVAAQVDPVLLAELPFFPAEVLFENGEYTLAATAHWKPIMNGYSGFTPDSYRRRASALWFFPEDWAVAQMKKEGATHVMVHLERFDRSEVAPILAAIAKRTDFELLAEDAIGHKLYRLKP